MSDATLPLEGIAVVSLEQAVAAPFATRQLADLGARVIKVERPGVGDFARGYDETVRGMSSHFVWLNRSKESLALNLKEDKSKEVLRRLVARSDVVVQNLAAADIAAGMYAYSGILSALFRRERTGEGATLEVSMLEALAEWMGFPAYFAGYGGEEPRRSGASHAAIAPYGPFACADGEVVFLGIQNEREWKRFCEVVLGREGMAEDDRFDKNSRRVENREELHAEIEKVFSSLSSEEAIERLER